MPLPPDAHDARLEHTTATGTGMDSTDAASPRFHFPRMDSASITSMPRGVSSQSLLRHHRNDLSSLSLSSRISFPGRAAAALEVYDLMYGDVPETTPADAVERLYEANAVYENPLVTASSRQIIADINALSRQLRELDVPRPLAVFKTLFRPQTVTGGEGEAGERWFQALRVWSDIEDICDSESFDGHRTSIIEHTLNVLLLPGLHSDARGAGAGADHHYPEGDASSVVSLPTSLPGSTSTPSPRLAVPGLGGRVCVPSPLHLRLRVMTRLSVNEQGRITKHVDLWDVRDVLGLVPGMHAAQWVGTRVAAHGLSLAARAAGWLFGRRGADKDTDTDVERGGGVDTSTNTNTNALRLSLEEGWPENSSKASRPRGVYVLPRRTSAAAADGTDV